MPSDSLLLCTLVLFTVSPSNIVNGFKARYRFLLADDDNAAACSPRRRLKVARITAGYILRRSSLLSARGSLAAFCNYAPSVLFEIIPCVRGLSNYHLLSARWRKHTRFAATMWQPADRVLKFCLLEGGPSSSTPYVRR